MPKVRSEVFTKPLIHCRGYADARMFFLTALSGKSVSSLVGERSFWVGYAQEGAEDIVSTDTRRTSPLLRLAMCSRRAPMKNETLANRRRNWSTRRGSAISIAIRTAVNSLIEVCQVPWASQNELVGRQAAPVPQKTRMVLPGVGIRSYAPAKQLRAGFGSQSV